MPADTTPRTLGGRYHILDTIGRGGTATVYLAEDERLGRRVALKLLDARPDARPRLEREARRAAALAHPNVVRIHDVVHDDADLYLVMEYVEGTTLDVLLRREGPLPEARVAVIGRMLSGALAAAHDQGIVHRDVKPGNVIVTPDGQAKLTDFGTARAGGGDTLTQEGTLIGSAAYVAPEQVTGRPVGPRADLYALGIVLYELLTGDRPFHGDTLAALVLQRLGTDPPPPSSLGAAVSPAMDAAVLRAIARDPDHRFASARELAAALPAALPPADAETTAELEPVVGAARPATSVPAVAGLVLLGLLLGGALAAAGWAGGTAPPPETQRPAARVVVPDLLGHTVAEATAMLRARGLDVATTQRVPSEEEAGLVIGQVPADGALPVGTAIHLVVSDGPPDPARDATDASAEAATPTPDRRDAGATTSGGDAPAAARDSGTDGTAAGGGPAEKDRPAARGGGPPDEPPGRGEGRGRGGPP